MRDGGGYVDGAAHIQGIRLRPLRHVRRGNHQGPAPGCRVEDVNAFQVVEIVRAGEAVGIMRNAGGIQQDQIQVVHQVHGRRQGGGVVTIGHGDIQRAVAVHEEGKGVAAAGAQGGFALHQDGLLAGGRIERAGHIDLAPALDDIGAGRRRDFAVFIGAVLAGRERARSARQRRLDQRGGRLFQAEYIGAILPDQGGTAGGQRRRHAGAAHETIIRVAAQHAPAGAGRGAGADGYDVSSGRHDVRLGAAVRRRAAGGEGGHALRPAIGAGRDQVRGNGGDAVIQGPGAAVGPGGHAAAAGRAFVFTGADCQDVLGGGRSVERGGVHHAVAIVVNAFIASGVGDQQARMIPDELVGSHRVARIFPGNGAAPAVGVDAGTHGKRRFVELVEVIGQVEGRGGGHDRLKDQAGAGSGTFILPARGRAGAHQGAHDVRAMIKGVAPVGQPAGVEHLEQAAGEIRMQRVGVAGVQAGVGHGHDLAGAIQAVCFPGGVDIEVIVRAGEIVQEPGGFMVFDPLHLGPGGQLQGGLGRQDGAHQAPAFGGGGPDVGGALGRQLLRQGAGIFGGERLDGHRHGEIRMLAGQAGQQGLDFIDRAVFPRPGRMRPGAQAVPQRVGDFKQERVVRKIRADGGAGGFQRQAPVRLNRGVEHYDPRIAAGRRPGMNHRAEIHARPDGGRAQADGRAFRLGAVRGGFLRQVPADVRERRLRPPVGFLLGQSRLRGGSRSGPAQPRRQAQKENSGNPNPADDGRKFHEFDTKSLSHARAESHVRVFPEIAACQGRRRVVGSARFLHPATSGCVNPEP